MNTKSLITIALTCAILCLLGPFCIPLPISPVPISLTTLILGLILYIQKWKKTLISTLLYLLLGLFGLPVFSGFSGGPARFAGPTGGYLIGYLFFVVIAGLILARYPGRRNHQLMGFVLGTVALYAIGSIWLSIQTQISFPAALLTGVVPYLIGDAVKIFLTIILGPILAARINRDNN